MVTIQSLEVRFDVDGGSDEKVFSHLFARYIRHWAACEKAREVRDRQDADERSLGDRDPASAA